MTIRQKAGGLWDAGKALASYTRSFSVSDALRTNQIDLLKIFTALFIVKEVHASFIESDGNKIPITDSILRKVFFIFGCYCLTAVLRYLKEYFRFVELDATKQQEGAKEIDAPITVNLAQLAILSEMIRQLDIDIDRASKTHPAFNIIVSIIDFLVPLFLTIFAFVLAFI